MNVYYAPTVVTIITAFETTITTQMTHARRVSHPGDTRGPIFAALAVNNTRGIAAKGSCRLSTT